MSSGYSPAWWLPSPHLQTLWGKFFRRRPLHPTAVERLDTPDGDFLDIHHLPASADTPDTTPVLILLHGLEGTIRSHYIQGLLDTARERRWRAAVLVFRSCGTEMNRSRRFYHSGETTDLALTIEHLSRRFPRAPLLLAGASLGGNVLLKYLGEQGGDVSSNIRAAVAISVPFDLNRSSAHIDRGFAKVYQRHFLRSLRRKALAKLECYPDLTPRVQLLNARTIFAFDDCFTAPVHGFADACDYYSKSSSINWISQIGLNTLLLNAVDDPFLPPQVLHEVREIARDNPALELEFTPKGGHVGFVSGRSPMAPAYYLEKRAGDFLAAQLENFATV